MSSSRKSLKVDIIGIYPPPIGGVSVHIKRLKRLLEKNNIECTVYDTNPVTSVDNLNIVPLDDFKLWLLKYFFTVIANIVHYHGSSWVRRAALMFLKLRQRKVVFTFHSFRDEIAHWGFLRRCVVKFVLLLGDSFVVVNSEIQNKLIELGAHPSKVVVIPAFIPPEIDETDFALVPDYVWRFIENHSPIIAANAFRLSFYKGQDLYGLDLCVDLCVSLKEIFSNIGFVFSLPDIGEKQYFALIQERIKEKGISSNFLFTHEEMEFYPILSKANLFVRPTNTDGDSISVREALHLAVPVVASDVVKRPGNVVLFENRNSQDLYDKVLQVLNSSIKDDLEEQQSSFIFSTYRKLYDELL
jgi:glycosyltransferase involved in cell wall biosynthesis